MTLFGVNLLSLELAALLRNFESIAAAPYPDVTKTKLS